MKLKKDFPSEIKDIIFDLGGVLLDIDLQKTVDAFERLHIRGLRPEDIHPRQKRFFLDLELGLISEKDFIREIRTAYPDAARIPEEEIWAAWNALLGGFDPQRFALLRRLQPRYRLYLLSNTNLPHRLCYLQRFREQTGEDFESFFTKCYYSDVLKMRKPDVRIYRHVIEDAGLVPGETLFIDDNACNFSGACEAGLHTFLLRKNQPLAAIFE